jgi:hypothetical protein
MVSLFDGVARNHQVQNSAHHRAQVAVLHDQDHVLALHLKKTIAEEHSRLREAS